MDAVIADRDGDGPRTLLESAEAAARRGDRAGRAGHYQASPRCSSKQSRMAPRAEDQERLAAAAVRFSQEAKALGTPPGREASTGLADADPGRWAAAERPSTKLDDVVGLDHAKTRIRQGALTPLLRPDLARKWRVQPGGGILLYGPPGTGKTLLARAIAGSLDAALFVVKGSDLLSKWHSESERNLADLFAEARQEPRSVIFVDEFQWLAPSQDGPEATGAERRVLCQLLQELQGFEEHPDCAVLFMAATNYPWQLDPTAIRRGRFADHIYIGPPEAEARLALFERSLRGRPTGRLDLPRLVDLTDGYMAADIVAIVDMVARAALDAEVSMGREPAITQAQIEAEIEHTLPSATPELVRRCETWRG